MKMVWIGMVKLEKSVEEVKLLNFESQLPQAQQLTL